MDMTQAPKDLDHQGTINTPQQTLSMDTNQDVSNDAHHPRKGRTAALDLSMDTLDHFELISHPYATMKMASIPSGAVQIPRPEPTALSSCNETSIPPRYLLHLSRIPILPTLYVCLTLTHVALGSTIPYLLVSHIIQPMVLWMISLASLLLQLVYLLPSTVLDITGLVRGRPMWVTSFHPGTTQG